MRSVAGVETTCHAMWQSFELSDEMTTWGKRQWPWGCTRPRTETPLLFLPVEQVVWHVEHIWMWVSSLGIGVLSAADLSLGSRRWWLVGEAGEVVAGSMVVGMIELKWPFPACKVAQSKCYVPHISCQRCDERMSVCVCIYICICRRVISLSTFWPFRELLVCPPFCQNLIFTAARSKLRVISLATGELLVCPLFGSIFDPKRWTN